jgi:hypothetical protein
VPPGHAGVADRVLVTDDGDGQSRSALAAVRALAAAGYEPAVGHAAPRSMAASSRYCRATVALPPVDDPAFAPAVRAELGRGSYLTVLPGSDAALVALGAPGCDLVDKSMLAERAAAAGLPTVPTWTFVSVDDLLAAPDLPFPLVVKAAVKADRRASPASLARGPADLHGLAPGRRVVAQRYVHAPMRAIAGVVWDGALVAAVHQEYERTWPLDCGVASAAVTVAPDQETECRVLRLLSGYSGIFQAQFVGPFLIDVNPRVYGSLPLAVAAGVNLVGVYCDLLSAVPVEHRQGRARVRYRWLEGDLRSIVERHRAGDASLGQTVRALRPRLGTAHSVASLRDPKPLMTRAAYVARRLL